MQNRNSSISWKYVSKIKIKKKPIFFVWAIIWIYGREQRNGYHVANQQRNPVCRRKFIKKKKQLDWDALETTAKDTCLSNVDTIWIRLNLLKTCPTRTWPPTTDEKNGRMYVGGENGNQYARAATKGQYDYHPWLDPVNRHTQTQQLSNHQQKKKIKCDNETSWHGWWRPRW